MDSTQYIGNPNRFYIDINCFEHQSNQDQPSDSNTVQVNPKKISSYTNEIELKSEQAIYNTHKKQTRERQITIIVANCILCKTSPSEILQKHNHSILRKTIHIIKNFFVIMQYTLFSLSLAISLPCLCIELAHIAFVQRSFPPSLDTFLFYMIVATSVLAVAALLFMLPATGFTMLEDRYNSHHLSYLQASSLAHSMLSFTKDLVEKNEDLKTLLSAGTTNQGIKNILDNITKQIDAVITSYNDLRTQLNKIYNINKNSRNIETIPETNLKILKENMPDNYYKMIQDKHHEAEQQKSSAQKNLNKAEQQKTAAQQKFNIAVKELLISLIDNICVNFAENKDTQAKIKASFLNSCNDNKDDFKLTLTNIVNTCLSIKENPGTLRINSEINLFVENAVNNTIDELYKPVNDTNK
jgi:hypothetical protein